jgi:hypothetical protein
MTPEVSRRNMLKGVSAASLLLNSGSAWPNLFKGAAVAGAQRSGADPRPIPTSFFTYGNAAGFHIYPPGRAYPLYGSKYFEPSTIYDFDCQVATIDVMARATETNLESGQTMAVDSRALYRTMDGHYVGMDGKEHDGVFTFI